MMRLCFTLFTCLYGATIVSAAEPFEAFLRTHCVRCHGPEKVERDLRIDQLSRDFTAGADGHLWAEIVERIRTDEAIHVRSLNLYLGELRSVDFHTLDGGSVGGPEGPTRPSRAGTDRHRW